MDEKWNKSTHVVLDRCYKRLGKLGYYQSILIQTVLAKDYTGYFTDKEREAALVHTARLMDHVIQQGDYARVWRKTIIQNIKDAGYEVVDTDEVLHSTDLDQLRLEVRKLQEQLVNEKGYTKLHKEACDKLSNEDKVLIDKIETELRRLWANYPEEKE